MQLVGVVLLVSFVGGGKNKVRTHKVVGSLVLFVDVTELPAVSFGLPDKYILFVFCCSDLLLFVV